MSAPLVQIGRAHGEATTASAPVAPDKWRALRPGSAQIYVENRCHLRCAHCYETEGTHPSSAAGHGGLSLADYDLLFADLAALGVLFVTFTGGEVFLRKDFLDVVALARKHRFAVTIYTSGTLLDEARADRLAALKVAEVHVSVYSHDAGLHDSFTGASGSHAKSVRALALLHERGVRTVLKANILRFNVDHLDALFTLGEQLGADVQLDPSVRTRMDGDAAPLALAVPPDELAKKVLARPELASAFRKHRAEDLCTGDRSLLDDDAVICGAARDTLSIGADGSVSACGYFPSAAGRWRPGTLSTLWLTSPQFDAIREQTKAHMEECPSCELKTTCTPCMAYGDVEHGSIGACNTASRHGALASRLLAETKVRANAKMAVGRPLPIIGDATYTPPAPRQKRASLTTEP